MSKPGKPELFGTDGIRGVFGRPPLDEHTVRRLGAALADRLHDANATARPCVVLGGDTRDSTAILCRWLASELSTTGIDLVFLGTVPTPAVAFTTVHLGAAAGIAVSASHNPHPDNGIKLIGADGFKWSPDDEAALEAVMATITPRGDGEPELAVDTAAVETYLDGLCRSLDGRTLTGMTLVLDTGHGAASPFAGDLFRRLGAEVVVENAAPDGSNINRGCGSTHPEIVARLVEDHDADLGFSFDGDADRVIVADRVDGEGVVRDGDAVLYVWARDLHRRDRLPGAAIVATSMSNLGLEVALGRHGIELVRCGVGDREVVSTLRERQLALGGEQSGHLVDLRLSTTGDGLLTALQIADLVHRAGRPLDELLDGFERFPQLLHNLKVESKPPLDTLPTVRRVRREVDRALGDSGRLVLRYSGTEALVRIMLEGPDRDTIEAHSARLAQAFLDDGLVRALPEIDR
ncbi:MAG: phosphoglucosamine mutase [Acidobacteriota bacterium]